MTDTDAAPYRAWTEAFGDIYDALPEHADVRCPRCGHNKLQVAFVGEHATRIGYAFVWCSHCLHGIHISRLQVPEGVPMFDIDQPAKSRAGAIPDFVRVVPTEGEADGADGPDSADDLDDEEDWITAEELPTEDQRDDR